MLHADETPVRQLDPGKGKTRQAYLWACRTNVLDEGPPIIVFDYQVGRGGEHPVATEALHRIAELYHIESEARDYSPEQR